MARGTIIRPRLILNSLLLLLGCSFAVLCAGPVPILEIPITLALGWVPYLGRVVPQLNPDPWAVGTAVACLIGVTVGSHYFFRWLAGGVWPWKRTLRCMGLVVLMFVAGTTMVGMTHQTTWLVRSPEPLTGGGMRVSAARMKSANNLKLIGIAVHNCETHSGRGELPRSSFDAAGRPVHSWQTALLPYLEEEALHNRIDLTKPWTHPTNTLPLATPVGSFLNPAHPDNRVNGYGASHYAGNVFVVMGNAKRFDSFPQGIADTVLAGEVNAGFRAWGDPFNVRDPRAGAGGGAHAYGSAGNRPPQFVMLDGSVRTFDPQKLAELTGEPPE